MWMERDLSPKAVQKYEPFRFLPTLRSHFFPMEKITEKHSPYRHLEHKNTRELLELMNQEDRTVPMAVAEAIPQIEALVAALVPKMQGGGRLFYLGAGTSGRLGVVDASECPPTFGVPQDWVIGLIAGGDGAIRKAVEFAEDDPDLGWNDLQSWLVGQDDFVVGIAASGTTPYVVHGLRRCQEAGIPTGCITCNPNAPIRRYADFPVEVITGPEFITGSTRLKAGTAQKLVLNMISTTAMIHLGRIEDNKMVDMQLTNTKLIDRGTRMQVQALGISYDQAKALLLEEGSVRAAIGEARNRDPQLPKPDAD